jgi:putative tryptophan/tyrosine transport system substrate-binding protein
MDKFCSVLKFVVIAAALFLVLFQTGTGVCAEKVFQVGITQIAPHPALDSIRNGCIKALEEAGFVEGKNLKVEFINAQGDMSLTKTIADKFVAGKKDVIVTITTPSSQAVSVATKGTGIPVVFIAVTSPVLAGLVPDWEKPCSSGLRITGVSDFMPIKPQLDLIKQIVPNAKVLGIVCNFGDDSNTKSVNEMRRLAPEYGLKMVEANVSTSADIQSAGASLAGRADVAWIPMCNTTVTGLEALVSVAEEKKIPLFVPDHESVDRGGIGALNFDNFLLGKQGGKKVARILKGEDVCKIPVTTWPPEALKGYYVNPKAAERMGVSIPEAILKKSSIVRK